MQQSRYRHTQFGWVIVPSLLISLLIAVWVFQATQQLTLIPYFAVIMLIVASLFASLTVSVDERELRLAFGLGVIRRRVALADITQVSCVRNRWFIGWGIRYYGGGWLYNVSGLDAVQLDLPNGKQMRVGTDQPAELAAAIEQARADLRA